MAYSDNFPSQRPSFMFDASNAGRIPPNMTFSRSDSPIDATKAAASAVHYWSNEKSLSSENLLLQSSDFDTTWSHTGINGTPTGGQADPAGGTDGFTLVEDSANNFHRIWQAVTASGDFAFTVYAKQNSGTRYLSLSLYNASSDWVGATFDLAGSAPTTSSGSSSSFSGLTATQTASGGGFYKCTIKATGSLTSAQAVLNNVTSAPTGGYGLPSYTGDGTSSIDVAFASLSTTGATDYNATTTQIHRAYAPTLKSVSTAGQPRFEYDPADGQSAGILIEGQSTNLATYGSDLTNAAWNPLSAFIGGTAVGPDGTLSAVKLVASAGSGLAPRFRRLSLLTDTTQTFSIYVKPLEFQHLAISADGSTACMVLYNLSGSGAITSATGATGAVEQCGNGWFRVSFSYTTTPSLHLAITMQSSTTYQTETGNGYDGMLFALAQLENQSFSSSFIGTTSSTVTRAVDSLTAVTSDIGYTGGPMTLVTDTTVSDPTSTEFRAAAYVFVDSNNSAGIWATSSDNRIARVETGGIGGNVGTNSGVNGKAALSIDTNDIATCLNGGTVATDTSHALADFASATLYVGNFGTYANQLNGHIKRVALYSEALSDTNLQALTS